MGLTSVINCSPNSYIQDINPKIAQLCSVAGLVLADVSSPNEEYLSKPTDSRNSKRQDIDHVFLRFGRSGI
ncbi:hypothetical protein GWI33_003363 [Rhynchophorus ferrugineus]|uniref:Uncharacterized protein n=1 Tax=Rhynchophorus ferrugineus TaxID=354439 RepID=A0A834J086_RHYFE|nr:hypothetical protein GWI33_003363 [Rhynchophorus ferrugineus]